MMSSIDFDAKDKDGRTALHHASSENQKDKVELLIIIKYIDVCTETV